MSNTPPDLERFERALTDARVVYVAATVDASAESDPVARSRALAAAKAEHERAVSVAFADRHDS